MIELKDLVGTTILLGCEWGKHDLVRYNNEVETVDVIHFQLGPTTYSMYEDPDDGYRSHLGEIKVDQHEIRNTFAPCIVVCTHKQSVKRYPEEEDGHEKEVDILEIRCAETGCSRTSEQGVMDVISKRFLCKEHFTAAQNSVGVDVCEDADCTETEGVTRAGGRPLCALHGA